MRSVNSVARRAGLAALSMAALLSGAGSAQALVIDTFAPNTGPQMVFNPVFSTQVGISDQSFTATGNVVGGERDLQVLMTSATVFPQDNAFGAVKVMAGITNGFGVMTVGIDQGAAGSFRVQYDGLDGDMGLGSGLDLDLAAAGSGLRLTAIYNLFVVDNDYAPSNLVVRLTDMSGQSAALTRTMPGGVNNFTSIDYGFGAFEAANGQLDLRRIRAIELSGDLRNEMTLSGFVSFAGFATFGGAYAPTNVINPGVSQPGAGAVPEPGTWALMIAGFGLAGGALRQRRRRWSLGGASSSPLDC